MNIVDVNIFYHIKASDSDERADTIFTYIIC